MVTSDPTVAAAASVMVEIFAQLRRLRAIAPAYRWSGLGNVLGDYGELVVIASRGFVKAESGAGDFDAHTLDGRTVQIKTNRSSADIGFRGEADLLLVVSVNDDASVEEVYFGPLSTVKAQARLSARDNKWMIPMKKLRQIAAQGQAREPERTSSVNGV